MTETLILALEVIAIILVALFSLITALNLLTVRTPKGDSEVAASIAILIPMRNEAANARAVIESALSQKGVKDLQVIAIDDSSTDDTRAILQSVTNPHFKWRVGEELPAGWLGKNFAIDTLASGVDSDYLVFLDADVRLKENAVAASISLLEKLSLDYISPYPQQIALTPLERILQPLLQWSWFATLPIRFTERSLRPSTVVANGQFLIVRTHAYRASGGHATIKGEVLDDIELARTLRKSGFRGTVVDGSKIATCRMYESGAQLRAGYLKSQWRAFGGTFGALIAIKIMALSSIFPILLTAFGWRAGWICYLALVLTRLGVAIRTRSSLTSAWLHPLAITIWIELIVSSLVMKRRGELSWKGRAI